MYPNSNGGLEIRVFKTKHFARWARREKLLDSALRNVVGEFEEGLIDADLGAGLIKKRAARREQGKRGGYRVLLAAKENDRSIFLFGFSKKDRENLDAEEKEIYKKISKVYLGAPMSGLEKMCLKGQLIEVHYEKK